jgi:SAM-dependent MidA family methyltransferase
MTNTLTQKLRRRIAAEGPLRLSDYMTACLLDPDHGYYPTQPALGAAGDCTTAPEISQMFGEMSGLALAQSWLDQGAPHTFALVEAGPGRGTLMADILRATRAVPGFHDALSLYLIEASPRLRTIQAETLAPSHQIAPQWIGDINELPNLPIWFVANEFFDALPIRQFRRAGEAWAELRIGLGQNDDLTAGFMPIGPGEDLTHRIEDTRDGDIVEICPTTPIIAPTLATRIAHHGIGAALIIDYGDWRSLGDTLQALQDHQPTDPLTNPGQADLTAHVDFEPLAMAAQTQDIDHSLLSTQGVFLERLGITARAQALANHMTGAKLDAHISAHRRLTHPDEMGRLFKVLAMGPKGAPPFPGTETAQIVAPSN